MKENRYGDMNEKVYMLLWVSLAIVVPFFIAYTLLLFSKAGEMAKGIEGGDAIYVASEVIDIGTGGFLGLVIALLIILKSIVRNRKRLKTEIRIVMALLCMVAGNALCLF